MEKANPMKATQQLHTGTCYGELGGCTTNLSCVGKLWGVKQIKASGNSWVLSLPLAFRGQRRELGLFLSVAICEHKHMWPMKRKGSLAALSSASTC